MCKIKCNKAVKSFYTRAQNCCSEIPFKGSIPDQDDQVSEVAILLGRLMQYRFGVWNDYGGAVDYTLKEFRSRTKVSDSFFEKIILFLNRYWYYSRYLPVSLVVEK
ncbi:MAG TPA: hypothetical protein PLR64_00710 [Candidatus Dojkabacteria bacterium]|nr:hypothetical protein [Candidatus Dojkabacteria bacterium]